MKQISKTQAVSEIAAILKRIEPASVEDVLAKARALAGLGGPVAKPLPDDDAAFAEVVLAAATASKTGRFGRNKVFISHVMKQLAREGVDVGDAEQFKARLVSAHRRDLLSLNRADLVEAMKAEDVDESETAYLNATFHFVEI